MGFWHTGYMDFHEPTGLDEAPARLPITYPCQRCNESFVSIDDLRRHRFERHPHSRPLMFVAGIELGATAHNIIRPFEAKDFQFENVTSAQLNGQPVSLTSLAAILANIKNDRVGVRLSNDGAAAFFDLRISIADEEHLKSVETAVIRMARGRSLDINAIENFILDCKSHTTAISYCDGICHYFYGVMAKEQEGGSSLEHQEYQERYTRSADSLMLFERPLATTIRALIAFQFNHFADCQALAPNGVLRHAADFFAGTLSGKLSSHLDRKLPEHGGLLDLLTDHETYRVLNWTRLGVWNLRSRLDELRAHTKRAVPDFDKLKVMVILAETLAISGYQDQTLQIARQLAGNAVAQRWAGLWLEGKRNKEYLE